MDSVVISGRASRLGGVALLLAFGVLFSLAACKGDSRKRKKLQDYGPARPSLERLSQDSGPVGSSVTLIGNNFHPIPANNIVSFNGQFTTGIGGDTEILVVNVPFGASTGPIWVEVNGRTSNALFFRITGGPQIITLSPPSGPTGTFVTIDGINFSSIPEQNTIRFQWDGITGFETAALSASANRLTCFAPEGATSGSVIVEVDSQFSNTAPFIYTTPVLIDVAPRSGFVGNVVNLCGRNFSLVPAENIVRFNGTIATVTSAAASTCSSGAIQLTCAVPQGAEAGPVTVEVFGHVTNGIYFCVWTPPPAVPAVFGFTPTSGAWGDMVTVNGANFSANLMDNEVRFNGRIAQVITASTNQIDCLVPDGASTGPISVTRGAETATSAGDFTVSNPAPPPPALQILKPSSGQEQSSVVIEGTDFSPVPGDNIVLFAGEQAEVLAASTTHLMVKVPFTESGVVTVQVGDQMSNGLNFSIEGAPAGLNTFPFFGRQLSSPSDSVIYVVDMSGSMGFGFGTYENRLGQTIGNATRIQVVQDRMIFSVSELPGNFRFNIITYSSGGVTCPNNTFWRPTPVQATQANKDAAIQWINGWFPGGGTATTYAVEAALQNDFTNQTICVITDGQWNCPAGENDTQQLCRIFNANLQSAQIHTVSVLLGGAFAELLKDIARVTNGTFTKVDPPYLWK